MKIRFNPERIERVTGSSHRRYERVYERYVLNDSNAQIGSLLDMSDGKANSWLYRLENSNCRKRRKR